MFLRRDNKLETLIGGSTEFSGEINTVGTLRIDGKMTGNIIAEWVVLGETAFVKGNIKSKGVVIGGRVEGNVDAEELVDIKYTGKLYGDIHTGKLSVAEGGLFEGRSQIRKDESKVIDFPGKEAVSK
jgi:cytoskeletal protein CcmA (bactofilin family)